MKALFVLCLLAFSIQPWQLHAQVSSGQQPREKDAEAYANQLVEAPLKHYRSAQSHLNFLSSRQEAELIRKRLEEAFETKSPSEKAAVKYMIAACHKAEVTNNARWDRKADTAEAKRSALSALLDAYGLAGEDAHGRQLKTAISSAIARWLLAPRTDWLTAELEKRTLEGHLNAVPLPSDLEEAAMLAGEYRAVHGENALAKRRDAMVASGLEKFNDAYSVMCATSALDGPVKALPYAEDILARFMTDTQKIYPTIVQIADVYVHAAPERVEKVFSEYTQKNEGLYAQLYLAAKAVQAKDGGSVDYAALLTPVLAKLEAGLPAELEDAVKTRRLLAKQVQLAKDLCKRREYDASIAVCDAAFRLDPDGQRKEYWEALNCKASCYEKSRRFTDARECYGRCAEDAKASPEAKKVARRALLNIEEMERMNSVYRPLKDSGRTPGRGIHNAKGEE